MTFSLLEICAGGGDTLLRTIHFHGANLRLKYAGYSMLEIHFLSNPFSDPNFKDMKKLQIAML